MLYKHLQNKKEIKTISHKLNLNEFVPSSFTLYIALNEILQSGEKTILDVNADPQKTIKCIRSNKYQDKCKRPFLSLLLSS